MTKSSLEYPESPSGYVTFYNYKEPLIEFKGGFGYVGALLFDGETDQIQCHICGEWFGQLAPHINRAHSVNASKYKETVGLLQSTALISETMREKLISSGLDKRLQNLRIRGRKTQAEKDKISRGMKEAWKKAELQNIRGTCPAQVLDRMEKIYKEKGDKLVMKDFDNFRQLINRNFGSVKEACKLAGIPYREPGQNKSYANRVKIRRNDDELLDAIRTFKTVNKRLPSYSDMRRALLPSESLYRRRFGTLKNAFALI